jgi:hypothetical protein
LDRWNPHYRWIYNSEIRKTQNSYNYSSLLIYILSLGFCIQAFSKGELMKSDEKKTHVLEINERLLCPDDGLILGNGDLSVSVYHTVDRIIWRFGKGDVWDRRLDLSDDPAPITIEELAHGIKDEGWKCGPYGGPTDPVKKICAWHSLR